MGPIRKGLQRLARLNGTPRGIAGGFSLGLALSLVPIPFAGMTLSLALAPTLRFNLPATYAGTAVVNPVTGPAIYFVELWLGLRLLGQTTPTWASVRELDAMGWWHLLRELALPFGLGSGVMVVSALTLLFPALWWVVARLQKPTPPIE